MSGWWLRLLRYARPQAGPLCAIVALMLVGVALGILAPWPLKLIVDNVLTGSSLPSAAAWLAALPGGGTAGGLLVWLALATVALFLARRAVSIAQSYLEAGAGCRMTYALGRDLFFRLQQRSLLFHRRHQLGDLVRRVTADTSCVRELVLHVCLPLVTCAITLVATFAVMWQLSRPLAIFAMLLAVPLGLIVKLFARPMSDRKYTEWEIQGQIAALADQTLTALPVVQAFGREEAEDRRFHHLAKKTVQATLQSELAQHQFRVSTGAVNALAAAAVMFVGGMAVLKGGLSVGSVLVLLAYFASLYSPIETLAYLSEGVASAAAGARRVFTVFSDDQLDVAERPDSVPLVAPLAGRGITVRIDQVTFGYQPGQPVLRNVSLVVPAGKVTALIGTTGAGKSTLVSLLPRLFDPWEGTVYFDDIDTRTVQLASLRAQVSMVPQEPYLLPLTIAENIGYGRPDASFAQIEAAAIAASAHHFIERLPKGYDTIIGERGITLSGGERQRLSIARAMLKDAPVLILDEPTSAVDSETEAAVMEALLRLMQGRTTIIIAHRLSTVRRADQIVVLDNGQCLECGGHDQLLALRGRYFQFHDSQSPKAAKSRLSLTVQGVE